MTAKKIHNKRYIFILFFLCWLVYFVSYLGRRNLPAAMTDMISVGVLLKSQAGMINTVFFISYAIGQLLNGILGDKFNPKMMVFIGVITSAFCNIAMGITREYSFMLVFWGINGYALSMLWPPILRIFADMLSDKDKVSSTINISSAVAAGALCSYLLSATMLSLAGWQYTFYAAAIALIFVSVLWALVFPYIERHQSRQAEITDTYKKTNSQINTSFSHHGLKTTLISILFACTVIFVLMQGMLRDGVSTWVPTFITELFTTSPHFAVLLSTALPLINLCGPYAANFMNQRVFHNEFITSGFFFLLATFLLVLMVLFGTKNLYVCLILFSLITTCMEAINIMVVGILPLRFSGIGKTATFSGVMNFLTYVGSSVSTFCVGAFVDKFGWQFAIICWCILSSIGLICCLITNKIYSIKYPISECKNIRVETQAPSSL